MAKITRFFNNVQLSSSGLEIPNLISGPTNIHTGYIDQIIVSSISGSAAVIEVQVRYEQGYSGREKLAYLYTDGGLPLFVDSYISAPFSMVNPDTEGDLHLYLEPDADCIVNIRIDLDINNISGL